MKNLLTSQLRAKTGLLAVLLGMMMLASAGHSIAQDTLIAFGRISSGGTVVRSVNTVGGVVSATDPAEGRFVVEVNALNAFAGASVDDFVVHTTITTPLHRKANCVASVNLLTDHKVSIDVRTSNVEDSTDLNGHLLQDVPFYFAIHRVPATKRIAAASPYLFATGRIAPWGNLTTHVSVPGYETTSEWINFGNCEITFTKEGAFAGDDGSDYVVIATPFSMAPQDEIVKVYTSDTASDDSVSIRFRAYDAQDQSDDDNIDPENEAFYYHIYRVPGGGVTTPSQSNLALAMGKVEGATGNILSGASSLPDSGVTAIRDGAGAYRVFVESPGAFAGVEGYDLVLQVGIDHFANVDEVPSGRLVDIDDDTLMIEVHIDDVEEAGTDDGTPTDRDFSFLVHTSIPELKGDLKIGRKFSPSKMTGNNLYNDSGSGQKVKPRARSERTKFFFAAENDGTVPDTLSLRRAGRYKGARVKFIRLTGGRANVTAAIKTAGLKLTEMIPGETVHFRAKVKRRSENQRRSKIRIRSTSAREKSAKDVCLAKVKWRK